MTNINPLGTLHGFCTSERNNKFTFSKSNSTERWITLGSGYSSEKIRIDVSDSGPGIEDQFKAHLMEPFFTTKELGLGMGVGLNLSRAIAQDHGGTLTLRSDTAHTCFRLILPVNGSETNDVSEQRSIGVPYQPA
jgi:signal transduction histidine kinase